MNDGLCVRRYDGFDAMPTGYAALFEVAERSSVFLGMSWFRILVAETQGPDQAVTLLGVEREGSGEPVAVLPLWVSRSRRTIMPRRVMSSLANAYTVHFDLIRRPEEARLPAITATLARYLGSERPRLDSVVLRGFDVEGPVFPLLIDALKSAGFVVQEFLCFANWYQDTRGLDFASFLGGRSSRVRGTLKRRADRLKRVDHRFVVATDRGGLEAVMADYERVYAASWKESERYPGFIPRFITACADAGTLRLGILYIDGKPAAAQFWVTSGGIANIYKLAYDDAYKDYSVGSLLTAHLIRHALDVDRVRAIDYGQGDDAYKKDWLSTRRERWGIAAFNPRAPIGCLLACKYTIRTAIDRHRPAHNHRRGGAGRYSILHS